MYILHKMVFERIVGSNPTAGLWPRAEKKEGIEVLREELEKMKADDLAKICKEKGIVYYRGKTRLRREEMIEEILEAQPEPIPEQKTFQDLTSVVEKDVDAEVKEEEVMSVYQRESTLRYLERIEVDALVAFKERPDKLNTAAVQNVSFKRRQLKVITSYNKEFIVSFDDVVWVRTTKRWPKFVMDILKQQSRVRKRRKADASIGEATE